MLKRSKFSGVILSVLVSLGVAVQPAAAEPSVTGVEKNENGFTVHLDDGTSHTCTLPCVLWIDPIYRFWFTEWMKGLTRSDIHNHPFLVCTRDIESNGNYQVVNSTGTYRGAYQFARSTWNSTARHAGRHDLVNVDPAAASVPDQDEMALHLYRWQGAGPWLGRCAGL